MRKTVPMTTRWAACTPAGAGCSSAARALPAISVTAAVASATARPHRETRRRRTGRSPERIDDPGIRGQVDRLVGDHWRRLQGATQARPPQHLARLRVVGDRGAPEALDAHEPGASDGRGGDLTDRQRLPALASVTSVERVQMAVLPADVRDAAVDGSGAAHAE